LNPVFATAVKLTNVNAGGERACCTRRMQYFPIVPPITVQDSPKPRRLRSLSEARAYVDDMMRFGRPPPWRELLRRMEHVRSQDEAVEVIGLFRELLVMEHLLIS
jgi:hypothetical protein